MGKYLEGAVDDSVTMCDEIMDVVWSEPTKFKPIHFNDKVTCIMENLFILPWFLLITILLLVIVDIYYYYYHIKYWSKEKQILTYYHGNNKLNKIDIINVM